MKKIKISMNDLDLEEAENKLAKSLSRKKECTGREEYSDPVYNNFHDWICDKHVDMLKDLRKKIKVELERHVNSK